MRGLFVHVHKAAGQTVKKVLYHRLRVKNVRNLVLHKGEKVWWHPVRRGDVSDREFDKAFKFCFVRNPWDRVVSAHLHMRRKWGMSFDVTFEGFIFDILMNDAIIWDPYWLIHNPNADKHEVMLWEGKGNLNPYSYPGYFMNYMNFIGRFENFNHDFRHALRELGHVWRRRRRMPHVNQTKGRKPYAEYYTPRLREAVGELYYPDIVKFNYTFQC